MVYRKFLRKEGSQMTKKRDVTKAELLDVINKKLGRLKPHQRQSVMRGLKRQSKAELKRKAKYMKVEVDKDGYDILWR
jgi:hypothetical protein